MPATGCRWVGGRAGRHVLRCIAGPLLIVCGTVGELVIIYQGLVDVLPRKAIWAQPLHVAGLLYTAAFFWIHFIVAVTRDPGRAPGAASYHRLVRESVDGEDPELDPADACRQLADGLIAAPLNRRPA
jgi:hypothetical protein